MDMSNGFLGRFLIATMPQTVCIPNSFNIRETLDEMNAVIEQYCRKSGNVYVETGYSRHLFEMFSKGASSEIDFSWRRLANEYYPRFAFVLSLRGDRNLEAGKTILNQDDWDRAETLVLWFFANAERIRLRIQDDDVDIYTKKRENLCEKTFMKIKKLDKGNGVLISEISRSGIRNSTAKERAEALLELMARGCIGYNPENGRYRIISTPPEYENN